MENNNNNTGNTYDAFISYRRSKCWSVARLLFERLNNEGLSVFLDVDELNKGGVFDEKIYKYIETSPNFIVILAPGCLDTCFNPEDWVRIEIEHALKTKKNIIPILIDDFTFSGLKLPPEIQDLRRYNGVEINDKHFDDSISKLMNALVDIKEKRISIAQERAGNKMYQTVSQVEIDRLNIQRQINDKVDQPIYDKILSEYEKLNILDLGCGTGEKLMNYLGKHPKVSTVTGIDFSPKNIEIAKSKFENEKTKFYQFDIEGDDLIENLNKIQKERGIQFNLVHCSYLLLHLKDPLKLIKAIHSILPEDGQIIIMDIDDGLNVGYPDKNNNFRRLNDICRKIPEYCGNRHTGREIYTYLKRSGYKNIKLENIGLDTANYDTDYRSVIFESWFSWIKGDLENKVQKHPNNMSLKKDLEWLRAAYDDLEQSFQSNLFNYIHSHLVYRAKK